MTLIAEVIEGDCLAIMAALDSQSIDLTVTSPPYDDLRTYNGFSFDFEKTAAALVRITKPGGVIVWVVGDATKNGSETGSSYKQVLRFMELGLNLHDTMIYQKAGTGACGSNYAYWQAFEFMFVLSKGKPKTVNRITDVVNVKPGGIQTAGRVSKNGVLSDKKRRVTPEFSVRTNVWRYAVGTASGDDRCNHPAKFPERLASDHIISWSKVGDLVFDPFTGSGTTAKAALLNGRNFIGTEISPEYVQIARKRIADARACS